MPTGRPPPCLPLFSPILFPPPLAASALSGRCGVSFQGRGVFKEVILGGSHQGHPKAAPVKRPGREVWHQGQGKPSASCPPPAPSLSVLGGQRSSPASNRRTSLTARALSAHRQPVPRGPPSAADSTPLYRPTRPNVPLTARVQLPG